MVKYLETKVVLSEIPNEITLAINITNCPCACKGCHSDYLGKNVGKYLSKEALLDLIKKTSFHVLPRGLSSWVFFYLL